MDNNWHEKGRTGRVWRAVGEVKTLILTTGLAISSWKLIVIPPKNSYAAQKGI